LQYSQYRFKFYFNASHAIYLSGEMGQSHPHTWEVVLCVMRIADNFVMFNEIEKMCEEFLLSYQDVFINTVQPFTTINPTLENICGYFKEKIQNMLYEKGWLLLSIELSETPSRAYMISVSDELEVGKSYNSSLDEESLQEIVDKLTEEKVKFFIAGKNPEEAIPDIKQAEPEKKTGKARIAEFFHKKREKKAKSAVKDKAKDRSKDKVKDKSKERSKNKSEDKDKRKDKEKNKEPRKGKGKNKDNDKTE
jgi:6-pyruvoyltetrahydropterin/6-carboxytetrahydropterin synthase